MVEEDDIIIQNELPKIICSESRYKDCKPLQDVCLFMAECVGGSSWCLGASAYNGKDYSNKWSLCALQF